MTILLSPFFQVTPGSKAAIANLCIGDVITAIDGENTSNMTHLEAQNKIKGCTDNMTLTVARWGPWKRSLISGWLEAARGQTCLPDFRIPCTHWLSAISTVGRRQGLAVGISACSSSSLMSTVLLTVWAAFPQIFEFSLDLTQLTKIWKKWNQLPQLHTVRYNEVKHSSWKQWRIYLGCCSCHIALSHGCCTRSLQ